jgi:hypothetical protein
MGAHAPKKNQIDVNFRPGCAEAFEVQRCYGSYRSGALITHDESWRPVQAAAVSVSLQKRVGAELKKVTSILETKIPHNLF